MARPTDQEMTAIDKIVPKKRGHHTRWGHMQRHQRWSGGRGEERRLGEMWGSAFSVVSVKSNGRGRVGRRKIG